VTFGERCYYAACLRVGRVLRAGRYSDVRFAREDGRSEVRKRRRVYAPLLVSMSRPVFRVLGTGMRVLPQQAWLDRERELYGRLQRASVRIEHATLVLPVLPGATLSDLLADPSLSRAERTMAIVLAGRSLAELHRMEITHGDAMAENVLVDLAGGAAHWFDFETVHDDDRPRAWRRADDLRAFVATSIVRTPEDAIEWTLTALIDGYRDDAAWIRLAGHFASVLRRPLAFHLGQAPLTAARYRAIARLLTHRFGPPTSD
jgi:serine/threonine protein kinase